jgi:ABC-type polysaccharide/polyol phosphate export permease
MAQLTARRPALSHGFGLLDVPSHLFEWWRRRDLLWHMTVRHLRQQYKQSVLGWAWAFVNPLTQMLILSFVFSQILRVSSEGEPYPLFLFVGLVPWIFFSGALGSATDAVVGASSLVTKVYFPREILPTAAVVTKLVEFAFGMLILVAMMVYYDDSPGLAALWFPVIFSLQFLFTLGLSLPLAAMNLYFHDVRFLVGVALNLWFYLTPILYPVDIIPQQYRWIYEINPMAIFVHAYRRVLLHGDAPAPESMAVGLAVSAVMFIIGYYLFKKLEPGFADSI